jgi:hypothetical protein
MRNGLLDVLPHRLRDTLIGARLCSVHTITVSATRDVQRAIARSSSRGARA